MYSLNWLKCIREMRKKLLKDELIGNVPIGYSYGMTHRSKYQKPTNTQAKTSSSIISSK